MSSRAKLSTGERNPPTYKIFLILPHSMVFVWSIHFLKGLCIKPKMFAHDSKNQDGKPNFIVVRITFYRRSTERKAAKKVLKDGRGQEVDDLKKRPLDAATPCRLKALVSKYQ